jgi:hypothetical protein
MLMKYIDAAREKSFKFSLPAGRQECSMLKMQVIGVIMTFLQLPIKTQEDIELLV